MKHAGKARQAAFSILLWTLLLLGLLVVGGVAAVFIGSFLVTAAVGLVVLWLAFAFFTFYFFRDPNPRVPAGPGLVVSPAHGKVDVVDETTVEEFVGGRCRRISIFLSVFDVHVQNAPVSGRVTHFRYREGQFLNAISAECVAHNENALFGLECTAPAGARVGVRLVAGLIARRIVPWAVLGDAVERGERISLIQFGSRVEVYLPLNAEIKVKPGDRVRGGETVVATLN